MHVLVPVDFSLHNVAGAVENKVIITNVGSATGEKPGDPLTPNIGIAIVAMHWKKKFRCGTHRY